MRLSDYTWNILVLGHLYYSRDKGKCHPRTIFDRILSVQNYAALGFQKIFKCELYIFLPQIEEKLFVCPINVRLFCLE